MEKPSTSGSHQRWVILPDLHIPFHNEPVIEKIYRAVVDIRPYGIVLGGDFLDLHTLSKYSEDSLLELRDLTLTDEYRAGVGVLDRLDIALPRGCRRFYLYGNHEQRYLTVLKTGDHAKYGNELRSPEEALQLRERGYEVFNQWMDDSVRIGEHLEVIHGLYTPVHAAKKHLDEFQGSVIFGHTHRFGSFVTGKRGSYNIGFLGDIHSAGFKYFPRTKRMGWVNGFAVVHVDDTGDFWVEMVQIWNNRFVVNGRMY